MATSKLLSWLPFRPFREPAPVVALLRLEGTISPSGTLRRGLDLKSLAEPIARAFAQPRLRAVALAINSPGGSPVQSALIAKRIRQRAEERQVPVIAYVEDVAASGGYWLACAGDEIVADESSIVGSIGVVSAGFGFVGLMERLGIERRLHTAGERKGILDPFRPERPEDVETLKAVQAEVHESFKSYVRSRRGERLKGGEELFTGEFWTGRRGVELGLVDSLGEIRSDLKRRFGEKVQVRLMNRPRRGLGRLLRPRPGSLEPAAVVDELLSRAEERLLWSRFGL